jgi:TetR/AcrR family transcriptional regulator, lmrAB and yxaGH operons repressor
MAQALTARERIVDMAMRLFSRRGYAAVGLNEILDKSGAPKGSLYYYFPGGKEELAAAAVKRGADLFVATVEEIVAAAPSAAHAVRRIGRTLAHWMEHSKFRDGSPIAAVTLEMAPSVESLRLACEDGYGAWQDVMAAALRRDGIPAARARDLAAWIAASLEGALILARAEASSRAILTVTKLMSEAVAQAKALKVR